jgi:hypothetical protein
MSNGADNCGKPVKPHTPWRTDSTHVLAAVRDLNRVERVGESRHVIKAPFWTFSSFSLGGEDKQLGTGRQPQDKVAVFSFEIIS